LLDQTFSLEMGCSSLFRKGQLFALVILACCFSLLLRVRFIPCLVFRDSLSLLTISGLWTFFVDLEQYSYLQALYLPSSVYAMNEMLPLQNKKTQMWWTLDMLLVATSTRKGC